MAAAINAPAARPAGGTVVGMGCPHTLDAILDNAALASEAGGAEICVTEMLADCRRLLAGLDARAAALPQSRRMRVLHYLPEAKTTAVHTTSATQIRHSGHHPVAEETGLRGTKPPPRKPPRRFAPTPSWPAAAPRIARPGSSRSAPILI